MDVNVVFLEKGWVDLERFRPVLDDAERRHRAFPHDLAKLARQDQLAVARHAGRLNEENIATHRGPGEAGGDAWHAGAHGHLVFELRRPEDAVKISASMRMGNLSPSAMRTAAYLSAFPISRSRLRTPASRV